MKKRPQMKPKKWTGCYDGYWKGFITDESFAHPAKFSKGLIERILDYLAERKWIRLGEAIGDPFGGVATGGLIAAYRGYRWIGMELEPKFVQLGHGNIKKHATKFKALGVPVPVLIGGDSREFNVVVDAFLSSPPYVSGGHHTDVMNAPNTNGRGQKMKCHAIVSSPPYAGSLDDGGPEKAHPDGYKRTNNWTGYGKEPGQIGTLKEGELNAVVSSPPFLGARGGTTGSSGGITRDGYEGKQPSRPSHKNIGKRTHGSALQERADENIENLSEGNVAAIVSSPPYEQIHAGAGGLNHLPARAGQQGGRKKGASQSADQTYGDTPGQIAHAAKGPVDAILSSPPYADSINSKHCGIDFEKVKKDYPGRVEHPDRVAKRMSMAENMVYGDSPGQIGALKAVVASPPWMKNVEGGRKASKFKGDAVLKAKRGNGASDEAVLAQAARDEEKTLGDSAGQIGREAGETYWQAVAKVYHACFLSLKPGGIIALVVKDFVKDGKRMRLCDDTMRLLVWLGYEEVERIHAMLTESQIHDDLFEGEVVKKTERKSFFRRLHESKLAADDPRRIDFEEVLIARKPYDQENTQNPNKTQETPKA